MKDVLRDLQDELQKAYLRIEGLEERLKNAEARGAVKAAEAAELLGAETLGTKVHNAGVWIKRDGNGDRVLTTVSFNEYQRSNLLWLMCDVIGYDRATPKVPELACLQNGDWAGEVPNMLRVCELAGYEESKHLPNGASYDVRERIKQEFMRSMAIITINPKPT